MIYLARPALLCCIASLIAAAIVAAVLLARQPVQALQLDDYTSYQCTASGQPEQPILQVLSLSSFKALDLANRLCTMSDVREAFQAVAISWRKRGTLTAQDIVEQHYDLFLNRRYLVHGLVPEFERFYATLYDTPAYDVYWVAKHSQPELTAEWFSDKTLGLSEDFYSQSFYLLPSSVLLQAGIDLREDQKRFYPDVSELYHALQTGEVDVISNPDIGHWMTTLQPVYTLKLPQAAPSASWFIARNDRLKHLHCHLAQALKNVDIIQADSPQGGCA